MRGRRPVEQPLVVDSDRADQTGHELVFAIETTSRDIGGDAREVRVQHRAGAPRLGELHAHLVERLRWGTPFFNRDLGISELRSTASSAMRKNMTRSFAAKVWRDQPLPIRALDPQNSSHISRVLAKLAARVVRLTHSPMRRP